MMPIRKINGKDYYILDSTKVYGGPVCVRQPLKPNDGLRIGKLPKIVTHSDINKILPKKYVEDDAINQIEKELGLVALDDEYTDHEFW